MSGHVLTDRSRRRNLAKWDRAPLVGWRQLCAIARCQYHPAPVEWTGRIKDALSHLGFRYEPDLIRRAQDAVDRAHGTPLPVVVATPGPVQLTPKPLTAKEGAAMLAEIRRRAVAGGRV